MRRNPWAFTVGCFFLLVTVALCSCSFSILPPAKLTLLNLEAENTTAKNTFLGILEDVPGSFVGQADVRAVRLVFQKQGDKWKAFPTNYPDEVAWTITFDGKALGHLSTQVRESVSFYSHVGLQDIVGTGPVPTVGKKSEQYGGFLGTAVYRPLVATTQPFHGDPQNWKRVQLVSDLVSGVRHAFRGKFPHVTNCRNPDENVATPWVYKDENIKLVRTYGSRDDWFLVQIELTPYRCDGPTDDAFVDQWFVIEPDKKIAFLGEGMWLVDAGDYDNDGKSEVVFSIDGYDKGGYKLFYDDFKKHATFEFGYH